MFAQVATDTWKGSSSSSIHTNLVAYEKVALLSIPLCTYFELPYPLVHVRMPSQPSHDCRYSTKMQGSFKNSYPSFC